MLFGTDHGRRVLAICSQAGAGQTIRVPIITDSVLFR
jgi:hypothetical protein